jgi:hypothetical protein
LYLKNQKSDDQVFEKITGIGFPVEFSSTVIQNMPKQELLCTGVRVRRLPIAVNVYAIGLYCESSTIHRLKSFATNRAHDPSMVLGEFFKDKSVKTIRLVMAKDVDSATLLNAISEVRRFSCDDTRRIFTNPPTHQPTNPPIGTLHTNYEENWCPM